jgi:hypothetical protein
MAMIVIRCQYTGHYILTGIDTGIHPFATTGRIFCPYCDANHVWAGNESEMLRADESRAKPLVRQAS